MKKTSHTALVIALIFPVLTLLHAQTTTTLTAVCLNGQLSIKGAPDYFTQMGLPPATQPLTAQFYFGEGDPKNGAHTSQPVQSSSLARTAVFSDMNYCSGNVTENMTLVLSVQVNGLWKNFVFINGLYEPGRTSLQRCGASFICEDNTLRFEYSVLDLCAKIRIGSTAPGINFYFGPGNPLNNLTLQDFACENTTSGSTMLTMRPEAVACLGSCVGITGNAVMTVGTDVCHYENWQLTVPVCAPANGTPVCNALFDNCLPEINSLLRLNQSSIPCRQWKQFEADCDPDKWAYRTGSVGIGTPSVQPYKLVVKDGIITNHVRVQNCSVSGWCDYVFDPAYRLMPLPLVKEYIAAHGYLPDTPSADQVVASDGLDAGAVVLNHQLKTEEIFLHLIALKKEAEALQNEYRELKTENERLKKQR